MSSLSTLTCELIFYLTGGPQSSKQKPLSATSVFQNHYTKSLSGSIFLGNPDTLVIEWVKLGFVLFSTSTRRCPKVVLLSYTSFLEVLLCSDFPSYSPSASTLDLWAGFLHPSAPAACCLPCRSQSFDASFHACRSVYLTWVLSGWNGPPSPRMTYDLESTVTPRAPRNLSGLNFPKLKSSFGMGTTGCQAKATVLSALVKEKKADNTIRKQAPGNNATLKTMSCWHHTAAPLTVTFVFPTGQINGEQRQCFQRGWHFSRNVTDTGWFSNWQKLHWQL